MISSRTNITDLILLDSLNLSTLTMNQALERMSTGYKINHARDNAANYSIATDLSKKISSMLQIQNNAEDGISLLKTASGGLEEIQKLLKKLRELSVQAANGTYNGKSIDAMQAEADAIVEEISRLRGAIQFSGMNLYESPSDNGLTRLAMSANVMTVNNPLSTNITNFQVKEYNSDTTYPNVSGANTASDTLSLNANQQTQVSQQNTYALPRSMSAETESSSASARSVTTASTLIEGAEDFSGNETRTITIDGISYIVKNRNSTTNSLSYSKDTSSGQIKFLCSNLEIHAQTDKSHDILITGQSNIVHGGDYDDRIELANNLSTNTYIYGGFGDDVLISPSGGYTTFYIYGENGNDILSGSGTFYGGNDDDTINCNGNSYGIYHGEAGNDIFNINTSYSASSKFYGEDGDDHFEITKATNIIVSGGGGNNTINDNGNNTTKADVPGANSFVVNFAKNETKTLNINNIDYTVTNQGSNAQDFIYQINNNGYIHFKSEYFKIVGDANVAHNVTLGGIRISFYGGNLVDNVIINNAHININTYGGNDHIYCNSGYSNIFSGEGDDILEGSMTYSYVKTGTGNDNISVTHLSGSYFDLGEGDDFFNSTMDTLNVAINGGNGNNTYAGISQGQLYGFNNETSEIKGEIKITAGETKNIVINNKNYQIKTDSNSNITEGTSLFYTYDSISDTISFAGAYVTITAQENISHNVVLYGKSVTFYGGNYDDQIISRGFANKAYGGDGNDKIELYIVESHAYGQAGDDLLVSNGGWYLYGNDGNDTLNIISGVRGAQGGNGNDIYNINTTANITDASGYNIFNINANNLTVSGGAGSDTFYVNGNNNVIQGAGGNDYVIIEGDNNTIDGGTGTNYYVDYSTGGTTTFSNIVSDPTGGIINFSSANETKTIEINGKNYTIKNNNSGANTLRYTFNTNTGVIAFNGSKLTINGADNKTHTLEIRGDNNVINGGNLNDKITVASGANNIINGNNGNDILTNESENNSFQGGAGEDTININKSTNLSVDGGTNNDTININSDNNTQISTGADNDTVNVNGKNNKIITGEGNNTINLRADSNTVNGNLGNNHLSVVSKDNIITLGTGNNRLGINGDSNTITANSLENEVIIQGNGNNITQTNGNNSIKIIGNTNSYTSNIGSKDISVSGKGNTIITGANDDEFDIRGDSNVVKSMGGANKITVRGDSNQIQGGAGVDDIKITGNGNTALGGDESDKFMVSRGNNNNIDGEAGERNTLIDNGNSTTATNVVNITPSGFTLNLKIGLGNTPSSILSTEISFNLFDFAVDLSNAESAAESIEFIDELLASVSEQLLNIGSTINRLEYILDEHAIKIDNMISTRSTLRDADIAKVSAELIKQQILQQASVTLIDMTRNISYNNVIGLLQGLRR